MNLHSNNNSTLLQRNNILWISRHTLEFIVGALLSVMLSATQPAIAQTQYGSQIKVADLAQACCVDEVAVLDMNGDGFDDVLAASTGQPYPSNASIPIQILLNDGHGGFFDGTSQVITGPIPKTINPAGIIVADFNGDGKPDIFIPDAGLDANPFPGGQAHYCFQCLMATMSMPPRTCRKSWLTLHQLPLLISTAAATWPFSC
jgi:hypothetical protein